MEQRNDVERPLLEKRHQQHALREGYVKYLMAYGFLDNFAIKGLTTVLAIFILENLEYSENSAAELVHLFLYLSNAGCVIGILLSDGFLGTYRSMYFFLLLQVCGYMLLTAAAIPDGLWKNLEAPSRSGAVLVALVLVGLGYGGDKTLFITFGCDEVTQSVNVVMKSGGKTQSRGSMLASITAVKEITQKFLAAFSLSAKCGQILGGLVSPLIRVQGAGLYFFVFLVPGFAKILSTFIFWLGRNDYHFHKSDAKKLEESMGDERHEYIGNYGADEVTNSIDMEGENPPKRTWEDWKIVGAALVVASPMAFFVALDSQTVSTWVFQGREMDRNMPGFRDWTLPPDEMPMIGSILYLLAIPLLEVVIYPFVDKHIMKLTVLRKLLGSLILATISFVLSGVLQIAIDSRLRETAAEYADISMLWQVPQYAVLAFADALNYISIVNFCYHEAPGSIKSAVNGLTHVVCGSGNMIIISVLAVIGPHASKVEKSFVFASAGAIGIVLMIFLSHNYVHREKREARNQDTHRDTCHA